MLRYHGVLAAHSAVREVVPGPEPRSPPPQMPLFEPSPQPAPEPPPPARHPWAWLLERLFEVDVMTCLAERCGARMRIVEIATEPHDIARIRSGPPSRARAPPPRPSPPGQLSLALG